MPSPSEKQPEIVNDQPNEASASASRSGNTMDTENSTPQTQEGSAPTEVGTDTPQSTPPTEKEKQKKKARIPADLDLDDTSSNESVSSLDYDSAYLKQRRKKSHHWRRQANKYGWVLEDRIKYLEKKFAALTGEEFEDKEKNAEKLKEGEETEVGDKPIGGVRILTWQEYCVDKGRFKPLKYAMIDVLLEEALPFNPHGKVSLSGNDDWPAQSTEELIAKAKDFDRLPERIRINSRPIQEMLRNISRSDEVGFVSDLSTIVCIKPFKMLYSLEPSIRDCLKDQENSLARLKGVKLDTEDEEKTKKHQLQITNVETEIKHIESLIQLIDIFLKPIQLRLEPTSPTNLVRFEELWLLFKPGSFVVVNEREVTQRIWKVVQKTGGRKYLRPKDLRGYEEDEALGDFGDTSSFLLDCCYYDFNGEQLGMVMRTFVITNFDGRRPIQSLNIYPLANADAEFQETKTKLREMGELFLEHTKVQHRYYSGNTLSREPTGSYLPDGLSASDRIEIGQTFKVQ